MSKRVFSPRVPRTKAKLALVSGEYPFLAEFLRKQGIEPILTEADERLPKPVRFHPDMQLCKLSKECMFVLKNGGLAKKLSAYNIDARETTAEPCEAYPNDAICNALALNECFVCNEKSIDRAIAAEADRLGYKIVSVKQGYTACSVAVVDERSVITADAGIAKTLAENNFDVLRISPGFIKLPGYDYGFIGGCCGLIAPKVLAVTGQLSNHPDGEAISRFVVERGVGVIEITDSELLDVGGIIPLM